MSKQTPKNVLIGNYSVAVNRSEHAGFSRLIHLEADSLDTGNYKRFDVMFFEEATRNVGFVNPERNEVVAFMPPGDFSDIYTILQTEHRVWVEWIADESNNLKFFRITTELGRAHVLPSKLPERG